MGIHNDFCSDRLTASGLSEASMLVMQVAPFCTGEAQAYGVPDQRYGFAIPYFTTAGERMDFQRLRFATVADGAPKYLQPPGTGVEIYFPPNLQAPSWQAYLDLPDRRPVTITEGELKAAKACQEMIPTIAVGGVWSFGDRATKELHPSLAAINWEGRSVELVFDSDQHENPHVARALRVLAGLLMKAGAKVRSVNLPDIDGAKVGLDDFLTSSGVAAFMGLERVAPSELITKMEGYAERYALSDSGTGGLVVYDLEKPDSVPLSTAAFKEKRSVDAFSEIQPNGKPKKIYPAKQYLEWPRRLEVDGAVYLPGAELLVDGMVNRWTGRGCEPWDEPVTYHDVKLWSEMLDFLFGDQLERRAWFERWCAYPFQNPGSKMYSATFLHSPAKGLGKTIVADTLSLMYGMKNVSRPSAIAFGSEFNAWAEREFVFVDELDTGDRKLVGSNIRNIVTSEFQRINEKYRPASDIKVCANLMLCSNHSDSIEIDHNERRFFVHRIVAKEPKDRSFYREYRSYFLGEHMTPPYPDGLRKLHRHFLDLDMGDFDAQAEALKTDDLHDSIDVSSNDFEHWLIDVVENPEDFAKQQGVAGCELFTLNQLEDEYRRDRPHARHSTRFLATTLRDYPRVVCAGGGDSRGRVATCLGKTKLFAIKRQEYWSDAGTVDAVDHFDLYFTPPGDLT